MASQSPIVKIFACSQSIDLASKISNHYGINLGNVNYARNILLKLYAARCGVDRVPLEVSVGRPPYAYRWNVK